jgi:hypothetical protein
MSLGYDPEQKVLLLDAIHRPYGMILVTGPTGSGKTVSLYTCLNILNRPGVNIATAEDPAEIPLPGINQVNVDDKAGLTFPIALKAFLRQDPDIIMVGEIRDIETAEIAIKAAQTGHMVLSTLHTNDAPATLTRLMNMGIPTFNLASSILLITAQRLVRRLVHLQATARYAGRDTAQCRLHGERPRWQLDSSTVPGECDRCKGSGYKGRVGLYEVMPVTEAIQRIIMANGTELDIAVQARRDGVNDLRRSGLLKVKQGTDLSRRGPRQHQRLREEGSMATAVKPDQEDRVGSQGACFSLGGEEQGRESRPWRAARFQPDRCPGHSAPPGDSGQQDIQTAFQGWAANHGQGYHAVYAPTGDDDQSWRAAAADVRNCRSRA